MLKAMLKVQVHLLKEFWEGNSGSWDVNKEILDYHDFLVDEAYEEDALEASNPRSRGAPVSCRYTFLFSFFICKPFMNLFCFVMLCNFSNTF